MSAQPIPAPPSLPPRRRGREDEDDIFGTIVPDELLGTGHLADRAQGLATQQHATDRRPHGIHPTLLSRLNATERILDEANATLTAAVDRNLDLGQAADWLLDNYYIVHEHIVQIRESLPRQFYRELPRLRRGPLTGFPRVYEAIITLIRHTEARLDTDNIGLFFDAFQQGAPLTIGELWSIPSLVRLGLIECLRQIALQLVERVRDLEAAESWAKRLLDASEREPSVFAAALDRFLANPPQLTPTFVARFLHRLRRARGAFPPLLRLRQAIAEEGLAADEAAARATDRFARTHIMVANAITSLRAVSRLDWRRFVEDHSVLDAALRADPSGWYSRMTFDTRDQYRHAAERIAKGSGLGEREIADRAVALATDAPPDVDPRRRHVGYYLIDEGARILERAVHYHPRPADAIRRVALRYPTAAYGAALAIVTVLALLLPLVVARAASDPAQMGVLLVALLPALAIGVTVVNALVTLLLVPRVLPRLELLDGIPDDCATAVVVPTLFPTSGAVDEALTKIEVEFLANRRPNLYFAILSDFVDSPRAARDDDASILAAAVDGVRALNARYGAESGEVFYLFHRPRRWNANQHTWMGWERKRGKLAEFNRFLRGADGAFSTIVGQTEAIRGARYVITLDADTRLPPDAGAELIGTLAHPLNRAVFDTHAQRVTRGYGVLQPRVEVSLPSANRSRFAAIYSGQPGVDPYTTAVSDVYQDLFGEGSFTGKGIYDVDAFTRAVGDRFPENTLLSHDLIEGNYARAGLVTDVIVYDDFPARYLSHASRKHRWIRGDWQLLAWLGPRVPGPDGPERNRLPLLARWKIFDNLRRSTIEIAEVVFLVAGWTLLPGSALWWTALGLVAVGAPWFVALTLAAVHPPRAKSWRAYYRAIGRDARTSVKQVMLALVFLPHQAWLSADAIARTLWRMFRSHQKLLEWQSASITERSVSTKARDVWAAMWPSVAVAGGLLGLTWLVALGRGHGSIPDAVQLAIATVPLAILWVASPAFARGLSLAPARTAAPPSGDERELARHYARLHWRFFERFATEQTHWLAPDNYQDDPLPVVAARTSATNIGLQLLSIVSAHDLGIITADDMARRLELVFATLDRLPRYRGHLFNWYSLDDLSPLTPQYVSTVDSGNLAGHLLALRQACLETSDLEAALASRLASIASRAGALAASMDFSFLFDADSKLLATGYNVGTHSLDSSYYDLLASEARLASFVAVAKKDVPVEHWMRLGRGLTHAEGATALVSWSGSMFEYLMPALVMKSLPMTILEESCRSAVVRQIAYGKARGVPWGISESTYNFRDRHDTYQYRGFGVPDLALRRGLERDLVVAPYAAALAAMIEPDKALADLGALQAVGALGAFGFMDAIDYTRPAPGRSFALVHAFMAHHIGMTLVALTNALHENIWQRRFHADPMVRSAELLLHERVPRRLEFQTAQPRRGDSAAISPVETIFDTRETDTPHTPHPRVALLGHMPYSVMLSHAGGGWSRYHDLDVTRWRADGTRDNAGQFCYVKDVRAQRAWSAAHQPMCVAADSYYAGLSGDRVTFERTDGVIATHMDVVVVPEDAAEVRRVRLVNTDDASRDVELTSYCEIVLAPHQADVAHPAFSNLFVETEWHDWCSAITATRRPRSSDERSLWLVHVVDSGGERIGPPTCETDRARFIGRGRSTRSPVALDRDGPLSGTTGAVLDPIAAIRTRVRLAPGEAATVSFTTLVADSRKRAFELADRYHDPHAAQRAMDLARTSTQADLAEFNITAVDAALFQELAGHLVYRNTDLRLTTPSTAHDLQSRLWANGISGDWPILLATIDGFEGLRTLRHLFVAHDYWRRRGLTIDLVVINARRTSYLQELNDKILAALSTSTDQPVADRPGGVFLRRLDALNQMDVLALRETARALVPCDARPLGEILDAIPHGSPLVAGEATGSPR
ncbi:MAG TPA: glucoamylase family protein, partial [Gemmatimonadaceae bacterium]|nr:glucoamylase family protein [Gemmatimonadaceae bacterium]